MTDEQNLKAILDTHLTEIKDEIKDSIIESILRLKTQAEQKAKWIPCSEQVPTASGEYLITWTYEWNGKLKRLISIVEYDAEAEEWHSDVYSIRNYSRKVGVIAWMPMPEAYKEADE